MNLYVMRHGTTVWNEIGRSQGRSMNRLSQSGKALVEKVSEEYKDVPFEMIISSPLMRTMQTSNIMNRNHGVKIVKDEHLIEIDQGIFTGRLHKTFTEEEKQIRQRRDAKFGIESYQSVHKRVKKFLEGLKKNCKHKNVLVVTHNNVATLIEKTINDEKVDYSDYRGVNVFANGEVKKFVI